MGIKKDAAEESTEKSAAIPTKSDDTSPARVRSALRFLRAGSEEELTKFTAQLPWQNLLAHTANDCATLAQHHKRAATRYRSVAYFIAIAGVFSFIAVIAVHERGSAQETARALAIARSDKQALETFFGSAKRLVDDEEARKFALIDAERKASRSLKDPSELAAFQAAADKVVSAIEESDRSRSAQFERSIVGEFDAHVKSLFEITAAEQRFVWHRDLHPLVRSVSLLLFLELFAGVFIALARRQEAISMHWSTQRNRFVRTLALPGLLGELVKQKVKLSEQAMSAIIGDIAIASEIADGGEKNPTVEMITAVAAGAERAKPETK